MVPTVLNERFTTQLPELWALVARRGTRLMVAPPLLWLGAPLFPLLRGLPRPVRVYCVAPLLRSPGLRRFFGRLTHPECRCLRTVRHCPRHRHLQRHRDAGRHAADDGPDVDPALARRQAIGAGGVQKLLCRVAGLQRRVRDVHHRQA